jgi:hypothetical protein
VWLVSTQPVAGQWADTRLYRLVASSTASVVSSAKILENYDASPLSTNPQGPVVFLAAQQVAAVATAADSPTNPALSIITVTASATPIVSKRAVIDTFTSTDPILLAADSTVGSGMVYVAQGDQVRFYAPQCSP